MNFGARVVNVSVAIRSEPSERVLQKQRQKNAYKQDQKHAKGSSPWPSQKLQQGVESQASPKCRKNEALRHQRHWTEVPVIGTEVRHHNFMVQTEDGALPVICTEVRHHTFIVQKEDGALLSGPGCHDT